MKEMRVLFVGVMMLGLSVSAFGQRQMERLNHGLIAVKANNGVFVSWRVLGSEEQDVAYNIYRNSVKVNTVPITGASNFLDPAGTTSATYEIKTIVKGVEKNLNETVTVWANNYMDVPVRAINGSFSTYQLNDASVGDLDGDGEYEIIVKRLANNKDRSSTDYHYLEAYKMDGTFLWAVNMGPNIYSDVEFNFLVWDLDGDGKAEVTLRTSEGFIDGLGTQIGDIDNDGKTNYRYSVSSVGYRMEGPDFISVLDGLTGKELDRGIYIPRIKVTDWGKDDGGHRSTKCMFTVAYLDGKTPSVVIGRGIYERIAMAAWDFKNGALSQLWSFDSNTSGNGDYAQQGYHNLTQGDVDNDGRDEIVYGSMVIDDDGKGLYSTKLGHGDAQHLTDINPDRKGLEYFGCLENSAGGDYRDAGTGEILFYKNIGRDMGRCGCADLTPDYPGMEMWGPSGFPFLSASGDEIHSLNPPSSMDFFIWWDGELDRELLDHAWTQPNGIGTITKYNDGSYNRLLTANGTLSNNWTKGTPSLQADIFGDWREEAVWRTSNNDALRIYSTTSITSHKIYTLMHDHQYRAAIGWQQNSYNQPPHPGFFIGYDMDTVPPAQILMDGQKVYTSGQWDLNSTTAWNENNGSTTFENGDSILFDISGQNSGEVVLLGNLEPSDVRVISPIDFVLSGTGAIDGESSLTKAGKGTLTLNTTNTYAGITRVWDGELIVNGALMNSPVLVKRFASAGGNGIYNKGLKLEKLANLMVSDANGSADTLHVNAHLSLAENTTIYMDLSDDVEALTKANDLIIIDGDIQINGATTIHINRMDGKLSAGSYVLASVSGSLIGDLQNVTIDGIPGVPFELSFVNNQLLLTVDATRAAGTVVWQGNVDTEWDLFNKLNWLNKSQVDYFIGEDSVVFNDEAIQTNIDLYDTYAVSDLLIDATQNIALRGSGGIAGDASLTKQGSGTFTLQTTNPYTGPTIIKGGVLKISTVLNASYPSNIGVGAVNASHLVLDGGTLQITGGGEMTTDRGVTIGSNNGTINVSSSRGNVTLASKVEGTGTLIKEGSGVLSLKTRNSYHSTIIRGGTIQLASDEANISGLGEEVKFEGGTLAMNNNSYSYTDNCSWNLVIEEGTYGTLKLDSRSSLTGKLTGAGTLYLHSPWIRNDLKGNWSAFSGVINVTTSSNGGDLRIYNGYGYENATINLGDKVYAYNQQGGTTKIGALMGVSGATLAPGTWSIGYNNKDATYHGSINGTAKINKYGTGNWTLTKANTYSGMTTLYDGTLTVKNTSGSATGTGIVYARLGTSLEGTGRIDGSVRISSGAISNMSAGSALNGAVTLLGLMKGEGEVNGTVAIKVGGVRSGNNTLNGVVTVESGGTLSGEGFLKSDIVLNSGAIVAPGIDGIGELKSVKSFQFPTDGELEVEVNATTGLSDLISSEASIGLNGSLYVDDISDAGYKVGDRFELFSSSLIEGDFQSIVPAIPGDGMEWDVSELNTAGILAIKQSTGVDEVNRDLFNVYPNPGNGLFNLKLANYQDVRLIEVFDMRGALVFVMTQTSTDNIRIDLQNAKSGIYMMKIQLEDSTRYQKLVIK